jgi:MoxR-like ATPase
MIPREAVLELIDRMNRAILGQEDVVKRIVMTLLAEGNVLLEGLPGLAKTRAVRSLATELDAGLSRIQFTPDLLPSDVTGTEIYVQKSDSEGTFEFRPGPIFSNLILADEINRAPAKVQSALLEAMEERQVTVGGKSYKMQPLFMVLATQNPIEQEGTYPLPEAQMDRFLMHVVMSYPSEDAEVEVLRLVRGEQRPPEDSQGDAEPLAEDHIFGARDEIASIHISESIERYIVALVTATRFPDKYDEELARWLDFGASPRGAIGLDRCARVVAWLDGRDFVDPDDVREIIHDVLRHRLGLSYFASAEGVSRDDIVDRVVSLVAVA